MADKGAPSPEGGYVAPPRRPERRQPGAQIKHLTKTAFGTIFANENTGPNGFDGRFFDRLACRGWDCLVNQVPETINGEANFALAA